MKSLLKKAGINLVSIGEFIKKERIYGSGKINFKTLKLLSKGFYSIGQVPFDFKKYSFKDYISDFENIKLSYLNYPYGRLLRDKLVFSLFFRNFCNVPKIYAVIDGDNIRGATEIISQDRLVYLQNILNNKKLIFKPRFGTGGEGIFKVSQSEGSFFVNDEALTKNEFNNFIKSLREYIVVEFIQQSEFSAKFFSYSTNTIRITTYCDPVTGQSEILYALMRFGRKKSAPADNVGAGGIYSLIDIITGKLNDSIELLQNGKFSFHNSHPESGAAIAGEIIPRWSKLKQEIKNLATLISPYIKFAGWDIILTDESFYLIEGNNGPDLYIQGPCFPLAQDAQVKKFLIMNFIRRP